MLRIKSFFAFFYALVLLLFGTVTFSSCEDDEEDTLTVEFTVGDVISNQDSVTVIGPSSYKIHYAGKVTYEAGLVISGVLPFDVKNGGHSAFVNRSHEATNHESYTSYSWEGFTLTHKDLKPGKKLTIYYTLFIKLSDGTYYYGPAKSFVAEIKE